MRKPALLGALLLVAIGVVLGATVFRTDIAQATGLANGPNVVVTNTAAQAVPVREQGTVSVSLGNPAAPAEPYLTQIGCSANSDVCIDSSDEIPDGKRLVIQTLSAEAYADVGFAVKGFTIGVVSNGRQASFDLLGSATDADGNHTYSGAESRAVTLYADGGTLIHVGASATGSGHMNAAVSISGYLVPMPN